MRLGTKLFLWMGAILMVQAVSFYSLTKYLMEQRTRERLVEQLNQANVVFKNFRAAQARLLSIVVRSVAEGPIVKAAADSLASADTDVAEIAKTFLEQTTSMSRTVGADLMMVVDGGQRVLTRVHRQSSGRWSFERAYGPSDIATGPAAPEGRVNLLLRYQSGEDAPEVTKPVTLPKGSLLATDENGFLLPPGEQASGDRGAPGPMPFVEQALKLSGNQGLPVAFWVFRDELYQVGCAPLVFAESQRTVGVIVVGYRIGNAWAEEIERASNGEVAFFLKGKIVASSFDRSVEAQLMDIVPKLLKGFVSRPATEEAAELRHDEALLEFTLGEEEYRGMTRELPETSCQYLVALSWTKALGPLTQLTRWLKWLGIVIFFSALVISFIVARGITRPLAGLSHAMESVMKGDYSSRLRVLSPREVAQLAAVYNSMVQGLEEREQYKKMVSRSATELVQKLVSGDAETEIVSNKVEATVLFSDIRSFTTLSESMSPEAVVDMLNEYFEAMGRVIAANDGDIDKFIGDAIMAFFKSTSQRDSAESAVLCAIQMQNEMKALNERRRRAGKPEIAIGVGLNTGVVVEGHVGTKNRFEHTMLGDTVNVASRLEGECKRGQHLRIVISQSTYERTAKLIEVVPMGSAKLKGKTEELPIYEIKGLADATAVTRDLDDPSADVRIKAIERVSRLASDEGLERLYKCLSDADPAVRTFTARILGQSPHLEKGAGWLAAALESEQVEEVRLAMLRALGRLGGIAALDPLRRALENRSPAVRREAVLALEEVGGRAVTEILSALAADPDGEVRATAALAMFRVGRETGISILEDMLGHDLITFRRGAAHALGEVGVELSVRWHVAERREPGGQKSYYLAQLSDRTATRLISALQDTDGSVRIEALRSLARMNHRGAIRQITELVADPDATVAREAKDAILKLQA